MANTQCCLPACPPARLPACLPACLPARLPACLPAYLLGHAQEQLRNAAPGWHAWPLPPSPPAACPALTACQPPHLSASCSLLLLRLPSRASTSSMKITQGCSLAARVNTALQVAHHSRDGNIGQAGQEGRLRCVGKRQRGCVQINACLRCCFVCLGLTCLINLTESPNHLLATAEGLMARKAAPHSAAAARATRVLPVPGGPNRSTPLAGRASVPPACVGQGGGRGASAGAGLTSAASAAEHSLQQVDRPSTGPGDCMANRPLLTCKQLWMLERQLHCLTQRRLGLLQRPHLAEPPPAVLRGQHLGGCRVGPMGGGGKPGGSQQKCSRVNWERRQVWPSSPPPCRHGTGRCAARQCAVHRTTPRSAPRPAAAAHSCCWAR